MIAIGGLPDEKGEVEAKLADWLNKVKRVHRILRLSPRLREKHLGLAGK